MKTDYQILAKNLNELLIQQKGVNRVYKRPQIVSLLKEVGIRTAQSFVTLFMKTFMTPLNNKGEYVFKSNKPIYFMDLKKAYEINSSYNRKYQRHYREEKKTKIENKPQEINPTDKIEEAIKLLKGNGYKVLKPVTEYLEC